MKSESFDTLIRLATLLNCNDEIREEIKMLNVRISNKMIGYHNRRRVEYYECKTKNERIKISENTKVNEKRRECIKEKRMKLNQRRSNIKILNVNNVSNNTVMNKEEYQ